MSLFFRGAASRPEQRAGEWVDFGHGGNGPAMTVERAQRLSYVYAAMRHIADFSATLPLQAHRRQGDARVPIALPQLFRTQLDNGTLVPWLTAAFTSLVLHGNIVGLKRDLDGFGYPRRIDWMPMTLVTFDEGGWMIDGQRVPASDVLHVPWITVPGQMLGLSPLKAYQAAVEGAQAAEKFQSGWHNAGGIPPGTFRNVERVITPSQSEEIRDRLVSSIRSGKPLVYGSDWEYQAVQVPPDQALFVETHKLTANQIAAVYGIEPQEIGGEAANGLTYNNEEHRQTKRLANVRPYLSRVEHGLNSCIPLEQRVKLNGDAIIRADIKTRHEVYKIKRELGIASRDELRALEDQSPIPGGEGADFDPQKSTPTQQASAEPSEDESARHLRVIHTEEQQA